jgi:hypothetical protein
LRALLWLLFPRTAWAQPTTGGGNHMLGRCTGLCSLGRRWPSQSMWWRARQVRALLWPLFVRLGRSQPATVVAGTTGEGAALAFVRSVVVGSATHCGGGNHMIGRCTGLCSLGRIWPSQPMWWRARKVRALLWPLLTRSEWAQPATVLAGTTSEGAALDSVRLVDVGSASLCGGGHDM